MSLETDAQRALLARIYDLVLHQAKDESLWCEARTIGEANIQLALRHLHAVIEDDHKAAEQYANKYGME
jgi:hypothetical protein